MMEFKAWRQGRLALTKLSQDKADTLLLLASCFCILAPYSLHVPAWISAIWLSLLSWRAALTWRGLRLPPQWLLLPLAIVYAVGVYLSFGKLMGKDPGISLLLGLLTCKLLEMHAKRDLFVVLFLAYFLLLAQFFYDQSIPMALWVIVTLSLLLCAQLSFQFATLRPTFWRRWQQAWKILGLAIPFCILTFFLFPRISGPLWGMPDEKVAANSGLSDNVSPGDISSLALSEEIAFRAKIDQPPARNLLYWRGYVLEDFDGRSWRAAKNPPFAAAPQISKNSGVVAQEITLEPSQNNLLFALDIPGSEAKSSETEFHSHLNAQFELRHRTPVFNRLRYSLVSYTDYQYEKTLSPQNSQKNLQLPPGFNPLSLEFALKLKQQYPTAEQQIRAVLRFFNQEKFEYTLEPQKLGRNSVDEFLFKTKAGFCEHYSSSFVFLMRAIGIPARVVTGYQGGNVNLVDGFLEIRQSDAHAWTEVWLPEQGWRRIDPTAAVAPERINSFDSSRINRRLARNQNALIDLSPASYDYVMRLRMYWDAINNGWYQWVLNFNQSKQRSLLGMLGFDEMDWERAAFGLFATGILLSLLLSWPILRNRQKLEPLDQIYQDFCIKMAKRNLPRDLHEGPLDYLKRLGQKLNQVELAKASQFIHYYIDLKYGQAQIQVEQLRQLKQLQKIC